MAFWHRALLIRVFFSASHCRINLLHCWKANRGLKWSRNFRTKETYHLHICSLCTELRCPLCNASTWHLSSFTKWCSNYENNIVQLPEETSTHLHEGGVYSSSYYFFFSKIARIRKVDYTQLPEAMHGRYASTHLADEKLVLTPDEPAKKRWVKSQVTSANIIHSRKYCRVTAARWCTRTLTR